MQSTESAQQARKLRNLQICYAQIFKNKWNKITFSLNIIIKNLLSGFFFPLCIYIEVSKQVCTHRTVMTGGR